MPRALDPWDDAQLIAQRLQQPGAELLVALGAAAWCQRCALLQPAFESICQSSLPENVTWLWLDLEDHAELIGNFVPEDVPLLLRWRDAACIQASIILAIDPGQQPAVVLGNYTETEGLPNLWERFAKDGWAAS